MSGETAPKAPQKVGRGFERNLDAGPFQPMIGSFDLHLRAEKKSPKTIRTYLEAAQWFAAEYLAPLGLSDWSDVTARHVQEWTVTLLGRYSDAYANNQFRALQQFGVLTGRLRRQDHLLDRHHAVQKLIMAAPDPAHAALTDRLDQHVPAPDKHPHPTLHGRTIAEKGNKIIKHSFWYLP